MAFTARWLGRRRRLLTFGGVGALAALARQPDAARAAHQVEDIGIGVNNPTVGPPPTLPTSLTSASNTAGFTVGQVGNTRGIALSAIGADNTTSGDGTAGVIALGGALTGGSGSNRVAGHGIEAVGGNGLALGAGGRGGEFSGGYSNTAPGDGVAGVGGENGSGGLAPGGVGVLGIGGLGGNGVTRTGIGVLGQSTSAEGVRGESAFGPGTLGVSANYVGVYASSATNWGLYAQAPGFAGVFQGSVYIAGGLKLLGGFLTAVKHPDGSSRAAHGVSCTEALIEDVGRARIVDGFTHIELDPTLAALIQSDDYSVFLSPEGEYRQLFVANRTASGFDVREQSPTAGSVSFCYRIVARRRDIERSRLAKLSPLDPLPTVEPTRIPHLRRASIQHPRDAATGPFAAPSGR